MASPPRVLLHLDLDPLFVSAERLEDPSLIGRCVGRDDPRARCGVLRLLRSAGVRSPLLKRVAAETEAATGIGVTASIGLAAFPNHGLDMTDLLLRADQALYAAKAGGKARYCAYSPDLDRSLELDRTMRLPTLVAAPRKPAQVVVGWLCSDVLPPFPLISGRTLVGRGKACDLTLRHDKVSRVHGVITVDVDGGVAYEDCSTNGTFVNGQRLGDEEQLELEPGDILTLGPFQVRLTRERPQRMAEAVKSRKSGRVA